MSFKYVPAVPTSVFAVIGTVDDEKGHHLVYKCEECGYEFCNCHETSMHNKYHQTFMRS